MPFPLGLLAPAVPSETEHIHSKNLFGGTKINSVSDLWNTSHELYMLNRCWNYVDAQANFMGSTSSRNTTVPKYRAMHDVNPGLTVTFHFTLHPSFPGHKKNEGEDARYYKQMNENDRANTLLYRDQDDEPTEIHFSRQNASANTANQATVAFKITNLPNRQWAADYAHDFVTGGNLSGWGQGGQQDISDFCATFHDSTSIIYPQPAVGLHPVQDKGSVVTIVSSWAGTNWTKEVEIDSDPGLATTGLLAEDTSYRKLDDVENMGFMRPSGIGFIGRHILGIKDNGDDATIPLGNSRIFLKQLGSSAVNTQDFVPTDSPADDWCIGDSSTRTTAVDHDSDGIPTGHPASQDTWVDEWDDLWDLTEANHQVTNSRNSIRGWNGLGQSFNDKEIDGWPATFKHSFSADTPMQEHGSTTGRFEAKPDTGPHEYDTSNTNMNRLMRGIYFGQTGLRANPGGHYGKRARGQFWEIKAWGDDYTDLNLNDAAFVRFFLLLVRLVTPPILVHSEMEGRQSVPLAVPENWCDFNTGWVDPAPIYNYDIGGGTTGPNGPRGSGSFVTSDWGERGFTRRLGNDFLAHVNCADAPSGENTWVASHLTGGNTPRTNLDEILTADWTNIQNNYLQPGETLERFDEANYVNNRVTDWLRANAVDSWAAPNAFGPYSQHPDDGDGLFTVANDPIILRDALFNDGRAVPFNVTYPIGWLEAHLHRIIPAP